MTAEQQVITIAKACGWKRKFDGNYEEPEWYWIPPNDPDGDGELPDYCNDLNAMHEAEQILWGMNWSNRYAFNDNLANTLKGRTVNRNEWDAETLLDATAAQRAEAFLRTIGKWGVEPW